MAGNDWAGAAWAGDWRVYLHLPAENPPQNIETALTAALETGAVGAVELPLGGLGDAAAAEAVDRFRQIVQPADVPLLAHGGGTQAVLRRLDGVRLDDVAEMDRTRGILGPDGLIGVTLGESRDAAMDAGEMNPDFVYLQTGPDFVAWWAELMVIPCVAPGGDLLADAAGMLARQPDFVALDDIAWNHPEGPAGAIRALMGMAAA